MIKISNIKKYFRFIKLREHWQKISQVMINKMGEDFRKHLTELSRRRPSMSVDNRSTTLVDFGW